MASPFMAFGDLTRHFASRKISVKTKQDGTKWKLK